jgi:hypothetical protein
MANRTENGGRNSGTCNQSNIPESCAIVPHKLDVDQAVAH